MTPFLTLIAIVVFVFGVSSLYIYLRHDNIKATANDQFRQVIESTVASMGGEDKFRSSVLRTVVWCSVVFVASLLAIVGGPIVQKYVPGVVFSMLGWRIFSSGKRLQDNHDAKVADNKDPNHEVAELTERLIGREKIMKTARYTWLVGIIFLLLGAQMLISAYGQ
jgi:hypothetical protein